MVRLSSEVAQAIVVFLGIQLSLAAFSSSDYLFMAEAKTSGGTNSGVLVLGPMIHRVWHPL